MWKSLSTAINPLWLSFEGAWRYEVVIPTDMEGRGREYIFLIKGKTSLDYLWLTMELHPDKSIIGWKYYVKNAFNTPNLSCIMA